MYNVAIDELHANLNINKSKNKILHVKNFLNNNFSWSTFIDILNYQYNNGKMDKVTEHQIDNLSKNTTTPIMKNSAYFHFHILQLAKTGIHKFPIQNNFKEINNLMEYCRNIIGDNQYGDLKAVLNFVGGSKVEYLGDAHSDKHDVLVFQGVGSVKYNIYDLPDITPEKEIDTAGLNKTVYLLEPNDLFFMPKGTVHQVDVFEPRATLILDVK
jgi:hypothetical protein